MSQLVRPAVLVLTILAIFVPRASTGQPGTTVSGTVTDTVTHATVPNATVVIEELKRQARSGADGRYSIPGVPPGQYHLLVRADKFAPIRSEITVAASALTIDLTIDPELHYSEVVSVSPDARNQFESYQPTSVLAGQELEKEKGSTIGETLQYEPGVAMRSEGPGPARPVIRGLDGDRVLILEDGQRMGDLSSQSGDHGVNVNPAVAARVEVVRGPATLLYGANAIGGLVNVITDDVPTAPVSDPHGSVSFDAGTSANEAGGGGDVTVGNGKVALHLAGSGRRSGDYGTPEGDVPNSFSRGGFADVGLAWTGENGYLGGSYAYDRTHYGIPLVEEGETNLDPRRNVFTVRGERRNLNGFINSVKGTFGVRRYKHDELDGEVVATAFKNDSNEFNLLLGHRPAAKLKGSIGLFVLGRSFSAEGEESLSPPVDQAAFAAFLYEEAVINPHVTFQFGGRVEHTGFTPDAAEARDFTTFSGSLGLLIHPSEQTTVAFSLARAARNPALEELYFHGPHAGNFAFENGNVNLDAETGTGFDVSLRWRGSRATGEATYFFNNIDNFIFKEYTGEIEDDLPVTNFVAGDARMQGVEMHADLNLTSLVALEGGLDYVHGDLRSEGQPMPRIPPLRGRLGVRIQKNALQIGADAVFTAEQDRIFVTESPDGPVGETPTAGSNLLKLFGSYSFGQGPVTNTITLRLDNVTNELYHNHLNYLKDLVPEVGRNFKVLYNMRF
jgi:iron complex outermembrane recepter protein